MYKLNMTKLSFEDNDHFLSQCPPPPSTKSKSSSLLSSSAALPASISLSSNPTSISSSLISTLPSAAFLDDRIRQAQECLETSASYMNEIESFFQELSTQRPTPITTANWPSNESSLVGSLSIESLETFDLDAFSFNTENCNPDVIDPSIFNFTPAESETEDEEEHNNAFGVMHLHNQISKPRRTIKKQQSKNQQLYRSDSNSDSPSSSTTSSRPKTPKFYSRSGQVADPSRGPCHNCHTTLTCYWRKLKGQYHCNACTLFFKRNKYHRSVEFVADKPIKRRNRKSKYASSDQ